MQKIKKGTWVEIENVILQPAERSKQLPEDTKKLPYDMKVRGFLLQDSTLKESVEIITLSGRKVVGILLQNNPSHQLGFGLPVYELLNIGEEELDILQK